MTTRVLGLKNMKMTTIKILPSPRNVKVSRTVMSTPPHNGIVLLDSK